MPHASTIAVSLDLTDAKERFVQGWIHRAHTGRWPLWRMLDLRRVGRVLYELAEWRPNRRTAAARTFTVLRWDLDAVGVSWRDSRSLVKARAGFRAGF